MRLAFLIFSLPSYRTLGPIIEAAFRDGGFDIDIVLGPDLGSGNIKSYQSANHENVPDRLKGIGTVIKPVNIGDYIAALVSADVVIALAGSRFNLDAAARLFGLQPPADGFQRIARPLWVLIGDSYYINDITHSDVIFWTGTQQEIADTENFPGDFSKYRGQILSVGYARADVAATLDRRAIRQQFGIAENGRCILYVPDCYISRNDPFVTSKWYKAYWGAQTWFERIKNAFLVLRSPYWIIRALFERNSHFSVLETLRTFCDANEAFLLMVPRRGKDAPDGRMFTPEEVAIADGFVPSCETYPQAMIQGILASDFVVCGYRSGTILDAVAIGRPIIMLAVDECGFSPEAILSNDWFDKNYGLRSGCHQTMTGDAFVRDFSNARLEDLLAEMSDFNSFRDLHTGPADFLASQRILASLRSLNLTPHHGGNPDRGLGLPEH